MESQYYTGIYLSTVTYEDWDWKIEGWLGLSCGLITMWMERKIVVNLNICQLSVSCLFKDFIYFNF